jgi:hypothetical protein
MNRRARASALAFIFFVLSAVPVRQANAFVPPLIPAPAFAVFFATPVGAVAMGAVALLGAAALYLTIKDAQDNAIRIPLGPNASNVPPSPVAAPSTSFTSSPSSATRYWTNVYGSSVNFPTPLEACLSWRPDAVVLNSNYCAIVSNAAYTYAYSSFVQSVPAGCPSGYTAGASDCQLTNSRKVTDDKICDMLVSGGQFATADDLNCPTMVDGSKIAPIIRNGKVEAYGVNSSGQPLLFTVSKSATTYSVEVAEQAQTATQTQVKTTTATVDVASGTVTSLSSSTSPGSIASPSAATVPVASPTTVDATNTPTVTRDATKTADIVFPTDYARQGEAQNAANPIKQSVDKLSDISTASNPDPVIPDSSEFQTGYFQNTFNPLLGWSVPGHSSECPKPNLSYTLFGHHTDLILDAHCTIFESVKSVLSVSMTVVWIVVALFIVLGA